MQHTENTPGGLPRLLPAGLYEQVIDAEVNRALDQLQSKQNPDDASPLIAETTRLDPGDSHEELARHLTRRFAHALRSTAEIGGGDDTERLARQIDLCNRLLALTGGDIPLVALPGTRLLGIHPITSPANDLPRPSTPLSSSCLLTGARRDPSLLSQLKAELATADRVDMLCSFIKWSGIRVLGDELKTLAVQKGAPLRVVTTAYTGATDQKAVDFLRDLRGAQVRVSYDTKRTRLHAKAYLFHRDTGFGTAYIGSSNLSDPAITDGLEWNVKISEYESPHLWAKIVATFETYWNDEIEFPTYSNAEQDQERLRAALLRERGGADLFASEDSNRFAALFDLHPYPFQQEILDRLAADRELRDLWRNLVVAATGTGKTMVAAFDYKRFHRTRKENGESHRLLFVAHREEILKQSLATFRAVLRDPNFGDLYVGRFRPEQEDHLFVSIQTYNSRTLYETLPADHFDYVVVDEFHHAEAPSYRRLLEHVHPRILLGLTATPERADGRDILRHFDGHVSAEIRLPEAIGRRLLCPFQYFGITDPVDHSRFAWRRGAYAPEDLEQAYLNNNARTAAVLDAVRKNLLDPRRARGLGFCVSVAHARYMAKCFELAGIPAAFLYSESPQEERDTAQRRLKERTINFLFVVDLYNEGVDIPEVDTVLFLRPTESLTVFLQQLGRGLRLSEGKECLTVLDFVSQAHDRYNWGARFRALLDAPKNRMDREVEDGFPHAPPGCSIQLERIAQRYVLDSIRRALSGTRSSVAALASALSTFETDTGQPPTLARFLDFFELSPEELYRRTSWTQLQARAARSQDAMEPDSDRLAKGLRRITHWDSPERLRRMIDLIERMEHGSNGDLERLPQMDQQIMVMLSVSLWGRSRDGGPSNLTESFSRLAANPLHRSELRELMRWKFEHVPSVPPTLKLSYSSPLELHSSYTRDEILTALGYWDLARQPEVREGVKYIEAIRTDVFFVTLNKTEDAYSPTTMYEDYAVSDTIFHWQSQSTTSPTSETGRRYIGHQPRGSTVLLFVREDATNSNGYTNPYIFLGPVRYIEHNGSRPMSILWRLDYALPARLSHTIRRA